MSEGIFGQKEYEELRAKYWDKASWTIWSSFTDDHPRANMRNLDVFDDPDLLSTINTKYVFVGLNSSGDHKEDMDIDKPWHFFHSDYRYGHDYKLRYSLFESIYWGCYITDIIKDYPEVNGQNAFQYAMDNHEKMDKHIETFKDELRLLGGKPNIIALGNNAFKIIDMYRDRLGCEYADKEKNKIIKVMHYSYRIGPIRYKKKLNEQLTKAGLPPLSDK